MYRDFLKQLEDFIFMENQPEKADMIFVPGNGYPQMAERAAELFRAGYADRILPSGRFSISEGYFSGVLANRERYAGVYGTEWEFLKEVLEVNGVPSGAIMREDEATYTWENAKFSRKVTDSAGLTVRRAILCCKNYHARRAYMYYQRAYPETEFLVCPSCVDGVNRYNWSKSKQGIDAVIGETDRIIRQFSLMM